MTKRFAVLGSPIEHSKSPAIHSAAYRVLGENWHYERFEVNRGELKGFVAGSGCDGFSVTMPLKEEAFDFAQNLDELAKLTGAVNTLSKDAAGVWHGYNTDIFGIIQAVGAKHPQKINRSLLLGSGATAASAIVAIAKLAPGSKVAVLARNRTARTEIIKLGKSLGLKVKAAKSFSRQASKAQLTISTLPAHALDSFINRLLSRSRWKPGGLLLDVAYSPWPSLAAKLWQSRGQNVASGLEMLIWQAIAQIRIFKFGNPLVLLPNESSVLDAMHQAID